MGPQIVCINGDGEYAHQIEVDEYHVDDEDQLDTAQYEPRLVSTSGNSKGSNVYYVTTPSTNNASTNIDTQPQSSQRQAKFHHNATTNSECDNERFLLSCLPALSRLNHHKNSLARLRITELLYKIEFDDYSITD